jgi:class 3 adenylate cyclase/tetratricopeptide (TPR) repeat protein
MQSIAEWLEELGLGKYAQRFAENGIDFSALGHLSDQDLKDLGVLLGHRRKLQAAIAGFPGAASPETAAPPEPKPRDDAERRQLTVMFTDLVGSTALSTKLDPEDLRSVIGAYQKCVAQTVGRFGGFVARYMGDGVLIYFGYPQAHEDDAERAVRGALALIEAVGKLGDVEPLQVRIGVGTGLVVVGDLVGSGEAQERSVVGETPNLAARLQAAATPGTIAIDATTRRLLGGLFEYRDLGGIEAKGFANRVQAYEVARPSMVESRFEALRTTSTPLIGRDEEIDLLLRRWDQAKRGEGCVVLVAGEAGIGKSRIAETTLERLSNEPHTRLRYFCSPHHQHSALYPSITQLERAAGFRRDDTDEQRLDKLEAVLAQGTNDLGEAVPLLAELLSIPTGDRYPPLSLTPRQRKERTLRAHLAHVEGLARRQPVLMVFEDTQWSDPTTRESLDLLIDRVPTLRVLAIIIFRPEFTPPWIGRPHVTLLSLSRLPPRQRAEMITHLTGGKALPKEIADQIIDRTDGVPLFIEEWTKAVVESGIVAEAGDRYVVVGPIAPLAIPTSLHASLLARLDRLAPTREVVQIAAALGRQFSHELINAVATMPKHQLDDALARLVRAELIFRRGTPPDAEYTFKHPLVQDAAYSTLLRSRRQQIHARIAVTLENEFPEVATAEPQLMAQHYADGGLPEKTVAYWLLAGQRVMRSPMPEASAQFCRWVGQQAMARLATRETVAQLQKWLDELAGLPDSPKRQQQELELRVALASALAATKGNSATDVGETIARALALAERIERREQLVPMIYQQWAFHLIRSEHKLALSLVEQLEKVGKARNDLVAQLQGCRAHGVSRCYLGEFLAARAFLEQCHVLSEPAHRTMGAGLSSDPYAMMLAQLAVTLAHLGYIDQARVRLNEAIAEARRAGQALTLPNVLFRASWVESMIRSGKLQHYVDELPALSTERGSSLFLGKSIAFRGLHLTSLGQAREGLALLTQGLSAVRATGAVANTPQQYMWLAKAHAKLGELVEGLNCLAEAEQIIETTGERHNEAEMHRLRGNLLYAAGDRSAAEESYHQALAIAKQQSAKLWELLSATSLARLWRDQGKGTEARDLLAPIYGWFTEGFDTPVLRDAKALLDELA